MENKLLSKIQNIAFRSIKEGNTWQAIVAQIYLDIEVFNDAVYDEVAANGATLSRVALGTPYATPYGDEVFDARYVVRAARNGLIESLPEDMREGVIPRLPDIEYLAGVPVPDMNQISKQTKEFRENGEAPAYRDVKQNYALLFQRSAMRSLKSSDIPQSDTLALIILSDRAAFEAHLTNIAIEHRDWLLNSVMIRRALYQSLDQPDSESDDVYGEVQYHREILLSTISHLNEASRQVKWPFNIEAVAHLTGEREQEESAA